MTEFNNRMSVQRSILRIVNSTTDRREELVGLSKNAIDRWLQVNGIRAQSEIATVLQEISSKLFFLACKSQEQVTDEYSGLSRDVANLTLKLNKILAEEPLVSQTN